MIEYLEIDDTFYIENGEVITDEIFEKGWNKIEELSKKAEEDSKRLNESLKPRFNTIEEALKYYNATPFSEWESNMKRKYEKKS
ncbi:MAG: hypothetical protein IKV15_07170 [Bacteroidaceae bacterium]|nr:hypothetical protein [Bacteroidaceae bacterium]